MLSILSVIGTRPEAIKMAPVLQAFERNSPHIRSLVCVTSQHREMVDPILALFGLDADFDLDVMEPDQSLSNLTATLVNKLAPILSRTAPDWVLAQGDTTTVFAAALSAYYHKIPFAHVEAGLRTGDLYQPFPEEMNRRFADSVATLHFAATFQNCENLLREQIPEHRIVVTGNTGVDALLWAAELPCDWSGGPLAHIPAAASIVLVTAHRRENFGEPLSQICCAIRDLALKFAECGVLFVYPVHPNPNVRRTVFDILGGISNVSLPEPLDYLSMIHLMKQSTVILTDSGGIQEEAVGLGIPVLVLREVTERPEGIAAGVAQLVGTQRAEIFAKVSTVLQEPLLRQRMVSSSNPYGDGKAAERIVAALLNFSRTSSGLNDGHTTALIPESLQATCPGEI